MNRDVKSRKNIIDKNISLRNSVIRRLNSNCSELQCICREGVTQGDPLAMITYGIKILPLIKNLKQEIPDVTYPWYADYAGVLGMFVILETYFDLLTCQVSGGGFQPETSKIILIVRP